MGNPESTRDGEGGVGRGEETLLVTGRIQASNMPVHRMRYQRGHTFATAFGSAFLLTPVLGIRARHAELVFYLEFRNGVEIDISAKGTKQASATAFDRSQQASQASAGFI